MKANVLLLGEIAFEVTLTLLHSFFLFIIANALTQIHLDTEHSEWITECATKFDPTSWWELSQAQ